MNAKKALQKWLKGCGNSALQKEGIAMWANYVIDRVNNDAKLSNQQLDLATRLIAAAYLDILAKHTNGEYVDLDEAAKIVTYINSCH